MFRFDGGSGADICLRPEGTAGVVRAALGGGLLGELPSRLFYYGPMFRRERPQKGRYRQFTQFGVEAFGPSHPHADAEVVHLGVRVLEELGVLSKTTLHINSLCDAETRARHREALLTHLRARKHLLSTESRDRIDRGSPLAVMDSKHPGDRAALSGAPRLLELASEPAAARFRSMLTGLDALGVRYHVDHSLVRGLDYYTGAVWEFVTGELGAQAAVLAGGRYDGLVGALGSRADVPAVGWAAGVERLALLRAAVGAWTPAPSAPLVWVVEVRNRRECSSGAVAELCLKMAANLRYAGLRVRYEHFGDTKRQLRQASSASASVALLFGTSELRNSTVTVKNMRSGDQTEVRTGDLDEVIARVKAAAESRDDSGVRG